MAANVGTGISQPHRVFLGVPSPYLNSKTSGAGKLEPRRLGNRGYGCSQAVGGALMVRLRCGRNSVGTCVGLYQWLPVGVLREDIWTE